MQSVDSWARDGLPEADRERCVLIRPPSDRLRHEAVPRDGGEGVEHGKIRDAEHPELLAQPLTVTDVRLSHRPNDQPLTSSRRPKLVRSRCIGVIET